MQTHATTTKPANWPLAESISAFDAAMDAPAADHEADLFRQRLLLVFVTGNIAAMALVALAAGEGWLTALYAADQTLLVRIITGTFLLGLGWSVLTIVEFNRELDWARMAAPPSCSMAGRFLSRLWEGRGATRASLEAVLKVRLASRLTPIRHIASMLVIFGLIGTVAGFIIALSGVDAERVQDVDAIAPMVTTLIDGLGVALHTTLVGALLNVWLMLDLRLLEAAASRLFTTLVERGADDV